MGWAKAPTPGILRHLQEASPMSSVPKTLCSQKRWTSPELGVTSHCSTEGIAAQVTTRVQPLVLTSYQSEANPVHLEQPFHRAALKSSSLRSQLALFFFLGCGHKCTGHGPCTQRSNRQILRGYCDWCAKMIMFSEDELRTRIYRTSY